jgi:hypothetical protein
MYGRPREDFSVIAFAVIQSLEHGLMLRDVSRGISDAVKPVRWVVGGGNDSAVIRAKLISVLRKRQSVSH